MSYPSSKWHQPFSGIHCKHTDANTRAIATIHHSSNSHFILSGYNSHNSFSISPHPSPTNITFVTHLNFKLFISLLYLILQYTFRNSVISISPPYGFNLYILGAGVIYIHLYIYFNKLSRSDIF